MAGLMAVSLADVMVAQSAELLAVEWAARKAAAKVAQMADLWAPK
jgi:hypothetical protein